MKTKCGEPTGIVLGLSGKIASGKTTLAESLALSLKWPVSSFGGYVRLVATDRGLDATDRRILQDIGLGLLNDDVGDFCNRVLELGQFEKGANLLIDGIRHSIVVEQLKRAVSPSTFRLVHVATNDTLRAKRLKVEDSTLQELGDHKVEGEIDQLMIIADLVLDGNDTVEALASSVLNWLAIQE